MQTDKFLLMTESHFRLKVASLVLYLVEFCKGFDLIKKVMKGQKHKK